jgi:hypothetical protein
VEIISRSEGQPTRAYAFSDYASFVQGAVLEPRNEEIPLEADTELSPSLQGGNLVEAGTHVRVRIAGPDETNVFGYALADFSHEKFVNLLRLYTPVGQVNDYLLHPAYHNVRSQDLDVELTTVHDGVVTRTPVPFDFMRLSDRPRPAHMTLHQYINAQSPRNKSVHTVHRSKSGENIYLSAADIQAAELVHQLEADLKYENALPEHLDDLGGSVTDIPRGFQLALSGGMRSEYIARPPRSIGAAFRGVILSETARPTLGRKHVVDQRGAIARAAAQHEKEYEAIRKSVLPTSEPPPATPAAARWKREFFEGVRADLETQTPLSKDLYVWCGRESREARVMIAFGELLARGCFGDLRVLRGHLQDIYDFAFLYRSLPGSNSCPPPSLAETLTAGGYAVVEPRSGLFQRYGIGEFKARGEDVLDDFRPDLPRKMPNTPDLLVCWSFSKEAVESYPWSVENVSAEKAEFMGQTHLWIPNRGEIARERVLPVISISDLLAAMVTRGELAAAPPWPRDLPEVYY